MPIQRPICRPDDDCCPVCAYDRATVSVPVSISPYVETGDIKVKCTGSAVLSDVETDCEETGSVSFVISQRICVEIPFCFCASVEFDDTEVSNCRVGLGGCRSLMDQTK